jgi:hypothetical protein
MKTKIQIKLKNIILFVFTSFIFSSCIYYEDSYPSNGTNGYDGKAYVRLNWYDREPNYIETDNIVPNNFYWNTYYRSMPGFYTVHYEYDYNNGYKIVTYAYEADVEVWINKGEMGGVRYNGHNGADSYFDMALYPDGGYDFTVSSGLKSALVDSLPKVKPMGIIDSTTMVSNGISMKIIYKRVEPRLSRKK